MREEKVAVENPWAANRHYSSSLPSVKKNQCQMIQYGRRLMPILKCLVKVTVAMVTLHSLLSSVQVLPQGTHA